MFRDLMSDIDDTVFDVLGDDATVQGKPVSGMFYAPWLQSALGKLNTSIREPHLVVLDADAVGVGKAAVVQVTGQGDYTVVSVEPDGTGRTTLVLRPV
ncbi:hypothetical protein ACFPAG_07900 [Vogesella sp. GCM10023246]|uniref:Uncharacterized protein n=1 Tax=Vogesella oryzagri TaxID=3160864 RepID=A0ABV1M2T1_9NEIS